MKLMGQLHTLLASFNVRVTPILLLDLLSPSLQPFFASKKYGVLYFYFLAAPLTVGSLPPWPYGLTSTSPRAPFMPRCFFFFFLRSVDT